MNTVARETLVNVDYFLGVEIYKMKTFARDTQQE